MKHIFLTTLGLCALAGMAQAEESFQFSNQKLYFRSYYTSAKMKDSTKRTGFKSDTQAFVVGLNHQASPEIEVGLSYAYAHTDAHKRGKKNDIDTQRGLFHINYEPVENLKIGTAFKYGFASYDYRYGANRKADVNVHSYGVEASAKKKLDLLTPEVAVAYKGFHQHSYRNNYNEHETPHNAEFLTLRFGGTLEKEHITQTGVRFIPKVSLFYKHDIMADENGVVMTLPDSIDVFLNNRRLDRNALTLTAGFATDSDGLWEIGFYYTGEWRKKYYDHNYRITAKMNF